MNTKEKICQINSQIKLITSNNFAKKRTKIEIKKNKTHSIPFYHKNHLNNIIIDKKYLINLTNKNNKNNLDKDYCQDFALNSLEHHTIINKKNLIENLNNYYNRTISHKNIKPRYESGKINFLIKLKNQKSPKKLKNSISSSYLLYKNKKNNSPLLLNFPISHTKNFLSYSEKERNERNFNALLDLKNYITKNPNSKNEIVKQFFLRYFINNDAIYNEKYYKNFANYINDNLKDGNSLIDTRLPMTSIIEKGIKYNKKINLEDIYRLNNLEDKAQRNLIKERVNKYRDFLERNYKKSVLNEMMKGLTKEEFNKYFCRSKSTMNKYTFKNKDFRYFSSNTIFKDRNFCYKPSIKFYDNKDLELLNKELGTLTPKKYPEENKISFLDKLNYRFYYSFKEKYNKAHPEEIPKHRKKYLEYIIAKRLKSKKDFFDHILSE